MKFATERTGGIDGTLLVVSRDLQSAVRASSIAITLQDAVERWNEVSSALENLYRQLNDNGVGLKGAFGFQPDMAAAPFPRAWQWLDGSAYPSHAELMQTAFSLEPIETDLPLMYQGMSHQFLSGSNNILLPSEADGIDFEGEFGIVTDAVPMGTTASEAIHHIRLVVLINDWSLRTLAHSEMKTGFGWVQAKPACSMAPVAVTPDELQSAWVDGRISATLDVWLNGNVFGSVPANEMKFGFHELVAHAARTRNLCAGTIVGSGTVSSASFRKFGSCCIAERRAIEIIDKGAPQTDFMRFGDRVRMEAKVEGAGELVFGVIDQRVVAAMKGSRNIDGHST